MQHGKVKEKGKSNNVKQVKEEYIKEKRG